MAIKQALILKLTFTLLFFSVCCVESSDYLPNSSIDEQSNLAERGGRGGRGGGNIHRGGGGRSHEVRGPSRPTPGRAPVHKPSSPISPPSTHQRGPVKSHPSIPQKPPGLSQQPPTRGQLQNFLDDRQPAKIPKPETPFQGRKTDGLKEHSGQIKDRVDHRYPSRDNWFRDDFWKRHPGNYYFPYRGHNWWRYPTWVGLTGWLVWNTQPVYYPGGYYYSETINLNVPVDYSQQSQVIDDTVIQEDETKSDDWLPLGVFALSTDELSASTPSSYFQLTISKEGVIAGTYYDASSEKAYPVKGVVDKETQRATWKVDGLEEAPIYSTGLYNLTEDRLPVKVHQPGGKTQDLLLTRLEEPTSDTSK